MRNAFKNRVACPQFFRESSVAMGTRGGSVMWWREERVFHPLHCLPNNWIPKDLPPPCTPYLSISQGRIKSCEESIYVLILGLGLVLDMGL